MANVAGVPSLIRVRNDTEVRVVPREGRFTMESAQALSPRHRAEAVRQAQELFIDNRRRSHGEEYVDRGPRFAGFLLRGPMPHVGLSTDASVDPGVLPPPLTSDADALARHERAERARTAKKFELADTPMVDFVLVANFKVRFNTGHRVHVPDGRQVSAVLSAHTGATQPGLVTARR